MLCNFKPSLIRPPHSAWLEGGLEQKNYHESSKVQKQLKRRLK